MARIDPRNVPLRVEDPADIKAIADALYKEMVDDETPSIDAYLRGDDINPDCTPAIRESYLRERRRTARLFVAAIDAWATHPEREITDG